MRIVEKKICEILKDVKSAKKRSLSVRDRISIIYRNFAMVPVKTIIYSLWNSRLAEFDGETLLLGVANGGWKTKTIKSRINAIASFFGIPHVIQARGIWKWTDDEPYIGIRVFQTNTRTILKNGQYEFYLDNSI